MGERHDLCIGGGWPLLGPPPLGYSGQPPRFIPLGAPCDILYAPALPAAPRPIFKLRVFRRVFMPVFAMREESLPPAAPSAGMPRERFARRAGFARLTSRPAKEILDRIDRLKMVGVAARFDPAEMVDGQARWDWRFEGYVGNAMNATLAETGSIGSGSAIALFVFRQLPRPAWRRVSTILNDDAFHEVCAGVASRLISPPHWLQAPFFGEEEPQASDGEQEDQSEECNHAALGSKSAMSKGMP